MTKLAITLALIAAGLLLLGLGHHASPQSTIVSKDDPYCTQHCKVVPSVWLDGEHSNTPEFVPVTPDWQGGDADAGNPVPREPAPATEQQH